MIRFLIEGATVSYQEEGQVRQRRQLGKQAIALAMQGRWREAVAANQEIIANFPNDVDAHNRLGRAYLELGEYSQAGEVYSRAVELDPYNVIAKKNLSRLSHLGEAAVGSEVDADRVEPQQFIEEIGKTGVVSLYRLAPQKVLARMVAGDKVQLKIDGSRLIMESGLGEHLGEVEPKHARRLIKLMGGGNEYTAAIVSSAGEKMTVIIREVSQHPSQAGRLSFPSKGLGGRRPYVGDRIFRREAEDEESLFDEFADFNDRALDEE